MTNIDKENMEIKYRYCYNNACKLLGVYSYGRKNKINPCWI